MATCPNCLVNSHKVLHAMEVTLNFSAPREDNRVPGILSCNRCGWSVKGYVETGGKTFVADPSTQVVPG